MTWLFWIVICGVIMRYCLLSNTLSHLLEFLSSQNAVWLLFRPFKIWVPFMVKLNMQTALLLLDFNSNRSFNTSTSSDRKQYSKYRKFAGIVALPAPLNLKYTSPPLKFEEQGWLSLDVTSIQNESKKTKLKAKV